MDKEAWQTDYDDMVAGMPEEAARYTYELLRNRLKPVKSKKGSKPSEAENAWQRMSFLEQQQWVVNHKGARIRYAERDDVVKFRKAFGADYPIQYMTSPLYGLEVTLSGKPAIGIKNKYNFNLFGVDKVMLEWDQIWDLQLVEETLHAVK